MKKRKEKKIRIKSLLLLLLLTAILLITSTYAWFTSNQTVTISQLEVNVSTGGGLQISLDGTTWKTIIQTTEITTAGYTGNTNQLPTGLEPVSTDGAVDSGKMNMFYGDVTADPVTGVFYLEAEQQTDTAGTSGYYIAFDVFLKLETSVATATPIYITGASGITAENGIQNAGRMAFLVGGNTSSGSNATTVLALASGSSSIIWEPNVDTHVSTGVTNAWNNYGITVGGLTGQPRVPYCGISHEIVDADDVTMSVRGITAGDPATQQTHAQVWAGDPDDQENDPALFKDVTPALETTAADSENFEAFSINPGITRVRIYMWVEGQDVDCENEVSGTNISFDLAFSLVAPETP